MGWTQMDERQLRILQHIERGKMDDYCEGAIKNSLANSQYARIRKQEKLRIHCYSNSEENTKNNKD